MKNIGASVRSRIYNKAKADNVNPKCAVQVDVGYGDAVTPAPEMATYPVMLKGMPAPHRKQC